MSQLSPKERKQPRDDKVIKAIGNHKVLSTEQIIKLYFPSYRTCQRRISEVLIPGNYISKPFYIDVSRDNNKTPLYRLEKEGKKLYKQLSGRKYYTPRWNINYLPHLVETNWILILLKDVIDSFILEKRIGPIQIDAYCKIKNRQVAIEVDLSETETKPEIQRQYSNYEKVYTKTEDIDMLIYFTNRELKLYQWIKEIAISDLSPIFVARNENKLNKLKCKLNNIC